ncbi:MAG: aminotransferase class I/II-fold pyridoxal phosphate-dependent enzyme [Thaumarchaeota archaeon]|nr:aminotransferase class I/II-fold pyridoxal phosphate-dependent enzyme [Nitrososphaerota archaeon]
MSDIDKLRDQIDKITLEIIRLLKARVELVKEIGSIKNNLGLGITNEERERQLRTKVISLCKEIGLEERIAATMLNFLLNESVKIQSSGKQTHLSIFLKAKSLEQQGKKIIHMEVGEPDFYPPKIVKKALGEVYDKGFTKYGESKGMPEFRAALARKNSERYRTNIKTENIMVSSGARFSVFLSISSLLHPGDEIIIIEPAWPAYRENALNASIKVRTVHTTLEEKWEPSTKEIESMINPNTKMIVLNYPNNPTGKILPRKIQDQVVDIAIKNGLYILSDEIYSDYAYKEWKSVLSYEYNKSIITQSFSKSHAMTGFRIGYSVSSPEIIDRMAKLQALCITNVSEPIQYVSLKALEADTSDNTKTMKNRLGVVIQKAKTMRLDFEEPDGAMYLFARVRNDNFDGSDFANKLLDSGVAVAPGEAFGDYQNFLRISACQPEQTLIEGMRVINKVLG